MEQPDLVKCLPELSTQVVDVYIVQKKEKETTAAPDISERRGRMKGRIIHEGGSAHPHYQFGSLWLWVWVQTESGGGQG